MPGITREEVAHLARLARLELKGEELDEVRPSLTPEQALSGAPAQEQRRFKVPQILGED
jgi:aspartyl-tRNA(Asn)/glutamyl-tRNA(Gln) amidotransferase subunit C